MSTLDIEIEEQRAEIQRWSPARIQASREDLEAYEYEVSKLRLASTEGRELMTPPVKFHPGLIVGTPSIMDGIFSQEFLKECLYRHLAGDWGDINPEDRGLNEEGLKYGNRLLSVYKTEKETLWIITEAVGSDGERESTTLLLPSEY